MRNITTLLFLILFCSVQVHGQLTAKHAKNAWQRTAYEDWDDFRPWWYFHVVNNKYRKTDRRTMYARMGQMTLWSVYADNYELHARSVDSVFRQETYKALDKSLNKNYLVLQRTRVTELYDQIEEKINIAIDSGLPEELYTIISDEYTDVSTDIDFLRSSYSPDSEKYPLIEKQIARLEELVNISTLMGALADIWENPDLDLFRVDYNEDIERIKLEIESLIEE